MTQNALKFRPKTYSVFSFFLDFFTARPLVLSVGPRGAFAKSRLALLHKNQGMYTMLGWRCALRLIFRQVDIT